MPKNKGKGGKNRKRGKNEADDEKRELVFKEDGQEYAQVLRMLGNGRCEAMCIDGTKRLCHIRGKMHKKVWIAAGGSWFQSWSQRSCWTESTELTEPLR